MAAKCWLQCTIWRDQEIRGCAARRPSSPSKGVRWSTRVWSEVEPGFFLHLLPWKTRIAQQIRLMCIEITGLGPPTYSDKLTSRHLPDSRLTICFLFTFTLGWQLESTRVHFVEHWKKVDIVSSRSLGPIRQRSQTSLFCTPRICSLSKNPWLWN